MAKQMRALLVVVIAVFMPTVARAGSAPACSPSGTALSIAARERKFDKDCLAAPADQPFTIEFDNQDPDTPHNIAIYDRTRGKRPLFKGEVIIGPRKVTYSVPAQASGRYEFRCEPHDFTMIGTFIIGPAAQESQRAVIERPSSMPRGANPSPRAWASSTWTAPSLP
jgi:plastocyanin